MKAALCRSLDGTEGLAIEEIETPVPGPGEIAVEVEAAALNFMDTLITRGKYQFKPDLPFSPSGEICGRVSALGEGVARLAVGQRVMAYLGWGGAREVVVAGEEKFVPVPDGVSSEVAAGLSITYGTALHGLADRASLKAGETVAVLGASGGAGLAAVEVSHAIGARVIAVASSDEKLEVCRQAGADDLLKYRMTDLRDGLKALTGGEGVDVVYDCVGGEYAEAAVRATAWQGRFLVVGFASGEIPRLPLNLLLVKGCAAIGVFWGEHVRRDTQAHRANMTRLLEMTADGRLDPRIDKTYQLDDIREALQRIENREAVGKIVLRVG